MRQLVLGLSFAAPLFAAQTVATADCGLGLFHQRHHSCKKCDETIVIHCYPQESSHHKKRFSAFDAQPSAAPYAAPTTLIPYQANYGIQAGYGMGMQMMPVMPMMGGLMPTAYQQSYTPSASPQQSANQCNCGDTKNRVEQLESDFKKLANQVDEVVNAVDRNTVAMEKLVQKLFDGGVIKPETP